MAPSRRPRRDRTITAKKAAPSGAFVAGVKKQITVVRRVWSGR